MKVITICKHESEAPTPVHEHKQPIELKEAVDYIAHHKYHFTEGLADYAISKMENANGSSEHISNTDIERYLSQNFIPKPTRSNMHDILYTANMAYADFYPTLLDTKDKCIQYALAVANDVDGYEGIEFCRWLADLMGKNVNIEWNNFI